MAKSSDAVEAVLLAAGLGTRMLPFTEKTAKPFLPLVSSPTIQYSFDWMNAQGVSHAVVNLHHLYDDSLKRLHMLDRGSVKIDVSDERFELLGSGGGIRQAMEKISGDRFLLVNSDTLFFPNIAPLLQRHEELRVKHGVEATLAVFEQSPSGAMYREIQMDPTQEVVKGISSDKKAGAAFFAGVGVFEKSAIKNLPLGKPSDLLSEVLIPFSKTGKLGVWITDGLWLDLGEPMQWFNAHFELIAAVKDGNIPERTAERVQNILQKTNRIYFDAKRKIYCDCTNLTLSNEQARFHHTVVYGKNLTQSHTVQFEGHTFSF